MGIFTSPNNKNARDEWVKTQLDNLPAGINFLDAGCGPQPYRKHCNHFNYHAQDFAEYDGEGDNKGNQNSNWKYGKLDYVCDITNIPVQNDFFDAILCTEVIEHVPFPFNAIEELTRITKPGGKILITAPVCSIPHQTPYYYYNGFSANWYHECAKKYNLKVVSLEQNGSPLEYLQQEFCRLGKKLDNRLYATVIKFLAHCVLSPVLYFMSKGTNKRLDYLHFGYHVIFIKL